MIVGGTGTIDTVLLVAIFICPPLKNSRALHVAAALGRVNCTVALVRPSDGGDVIPFKYRHMM